MADLHVIACNYRDGTKIAAGSALAYVCWTNPGGGNDRIPVLARSRGGRWVRKWEAMHRLRNFRFKTVPAEHPRYEQIKSECAELSPADLTYLREACDREAR